MSVYGYVNGKAVYSRDEFIYAKRGFNEITTDTELMQFAEKVTNNWYNAGHRRSFATYFLGDYAMSEPKASLTDKEYKRLIELQKIAIDKLEAEKARYNFSLYEGRPLTESEVKMFLDKHVEQVKSQWGENNYWTKSAEEVREEKLSKFRHGEIIEVASEEYTDSYGNGTGSYARSLLSDGTITNTCYGYLD